MIVFCSNKSFSGCCEPLYLNQNCSVAIGYLSWMNSAISFCICLPFSCFCRRTSKPATEVVPWGSFLSVCGGGQRHSDTAGVRSRTLFVCVWEPVGVCENELWMRDSRSHALVCACQSPDGRTCVCVSAEGADLFHTAALSSRSAVAQNITGRKTNRKPKSSERRREQASDVVNDPDRRVLFRF